MFRRAYREKNGKVEQTWSESGVVSQQNHMPEHGEYGSLRRYLNGIALPLVGLYAVHPHDTQLRYPGVL